MKILSFSIVGMVLISIFVVKGIYAEDKDVKRSIVKKQVIGEVSGISNSFISVEYGADASGAHEIALNMAKDVQGSHKPLKEIQRGDVVAVTYNEIYDTKKGEEPRLVTREAKIVEFRQAAPKEQEAPALESREREQTPTY